MTPCARVISVPSAKIIYAFEMEPLCNTTSDHTGPHNSAVLTKERQTIPSCQGSTLLCFKPNYCMKAALFSNATSDHVGAAYHKNIRHSQVRLYRDRVVLQDVLVDAHQSSTIHPHVVRSVFAFKGYRCNENKNLNCGNLIKKMFL